MISNFHMPLSTLLMIVAAFGGYEQVMEAYNVALKEEYRFGTYGDAMLIYRPVIMVVYFSLGTNLGDKEQNLRMAVQKIRKQIGEVISYLLFMLLPRGAFLPIILF